jgi:RNA polymerase subunit RPABC4/transcription elongation factor Spt4
VVAVVPAEACSICRAVGAVPVDSGICRNCGGKQKKL